MNALGNMARNTRNLQDSFAKVSSGVRITSASDDAAGLAVAENLEIDRRSARQARRNVADGISIVQTVEGATNEVADILKRQRELAVQSASETLANTERSYLQDEYAQLTGEVDRIARTVEFNGTSLGAFNVPFGAPQDGTVMGDPFSKIDVQAGMHNTENDRIRIGLPSLEYKAIATTSGASVTPTDISTVALGQTAITDLDGMLNYMNKARSNLGATQNRLESALRSLDTYTQATHASESRIRDADMAFETAEMAKHNILQQAGVAILGQANGLNQGALRLI
jgi:flagellin